MSSGDPRQRNLEGHESDRPGERRPLDLHSPTFDAVLREVLGASHESLPEFQPEGFTILETVGEGGFGIVVRARDERLDREVALKVLRPRQLLAPDVRKRFLGEARALAKVRHSNVLAIYSVIEDGPHAALVMEFLDGEPLSAILERQGPFGAGECIRMGIELCHALAAVHHVGLVHRDIKTPNIMREKGGRIVLTDFGLGACLPECGAVDAGFVAGSPLFMAPEQIDGRAVDPRTDLYGLGVVLYNLSTGTFPAIEKDLPGLFGKIRAGALRPLRDARPDLPKAFADAVMRALRTKPEERYGSAGEMEEALTSSLAARTPASPSSATTAFVEAPSDPAPPGPTRSPSQPLFSKRPLYVLAGTALVVLGLLLAYGTGSRFHVESVNLLTFDARGEERLLSEGETVGVGSDLFMKFRADADLYVYVLNEDERNRRHLLFPMAESQLRNPLAGGRAHTLPGEVTLVENGVVLTRDIVWKVDTVGEEEQLIVVVSGASIEELEALAQSTTSEPSSEEHPPLDAPALDRVLRGIGGKAYRERQRISAGDERLASFLEELSREGSAEAASGIWVRRITLRNPD